MRRWYDAGLIAALLLAGCKAGSPVPVEYVLEGQGNLGNQTLRLQFKVDTVRPYVTFLERTFQEGREVDAKVTKWGQRPDERCNVFSVASWSCRRVITRNASLALIETFTATPNQLLQVWSQEPFDSLPSEVRVWRAESAKP
jgi:hypothetical protein